MSGHVLTDAEWNAIRVMLPKERSGGRGRAWCNNRFTDNVVFRTLANGAPWARPSSELFLNSAIPQSSFPIEESAIPVIRNESPSNVE